MKNLKQPDDFPVILFGLAPLPAIIGEAGPARPAKIRPLWDIEKEKSHMARIASGDREAFSETVKTYMLDLYRFACSILKDKSAAEDVTQEAFLKLWTHAVKWSPDAPIKNWLFRITHNLCIDELRGRKGESPIDDFIFTIADPAQDASADYSAAQISRLVTKALFTLPERQRTALTLVHYSEYSNIEAASIMDISIDAIESLLARGRQNLRQALSDQKKSIFE